MRINNLQENKAVQTSSNSQLEKNNAVVNQQKLQTNNNIGKSEEKLEKVKNDSESEGVTLEINNRRNQITNTSNTRNDVTEKMKELTSKIDEIIKSGNKIDFGSFDIKADTLTQANNVMMAQANQSPAAVIKLLK